MNTLTENKPSPFHAGEQQMQVLAGVREQTEALGQRMIRDYMPDQHREFFEQLPFVIMGTVDESGQPWASLVTGEDGFITSPDSRTLVLDAKLLPGDPLVENLRVGRDLGLLGIAPHARRRNRMTGKVRSLDGGRIDVEISQAFGNCPMYIQKRELIFNDPQLVTESRVEHAEYLDADDRRLIESADTFFIASHYSSGTGAVSDGADASHRGGRPGFVRVDDNGAIVFPDFTGNGHFNTLGNLMMNPRAGLLFFDFENGDMLYVAGDTAIIQDGEELEAFEGALRLVRVTPSRRIRVNGVLPLRWALEEYSPFIEPTGTWPEVAEIKRAEQTRNEYRRFTVQRIEQESATIKSFYLEPADGAGLACYKPGQFLPIRVAVPGQEKLLTRTYTLSDAPGKHHYRLSIKREPAGPGGHPPGLVSNWFHDQVHTGSTIDAMAPRGQFVLDTGSGRPVVLLSAGVGITPMISVVNYLARQFATCGVKRDVWFVHGARNGRELAFAEHLRDLEEKLPHKNLYISLSHPTLEDKEIGVHHHAGRIDINLLKSILPLDDYEFYLCGPPGFMKSLYTGLKALNIGDDRIHYEFFGPATVLSPRRKTRGDPAVPVSGSVRVRFAKSGIEADWDSSKGTLLEFAEEQGIEAAYGCRSGACSTCSVRVLEGKVDYQTPPVVDADEGCALICSAVPSAEADDGVVLDL